VDEKTTSKQQSDATPPAKQAWVKPQVTFVPPQLTKHGSVTKLTGQAFFGAFSPGLED
jgi:hypothetical protein